MNLYVHAFKIPWRSTSVIKIKFGLSAFAIFVPFHGFLFKHEHIFTCGLCRSSSSVTDWPPGPTIRVNETEIILHEEEPVTGSSESRRRLGLGDGGSAFQVRV